MPVSAVTDIIVIFCTAKDQTYITWSKPPPVRQVTQDSRPTHPAEQTVEAAGEQDRKKPAAARAGRLTGEVRPEISTREEEDRRIRNMRRRHRNNYSSRQRVRNLQWCSSQVDSPGCSSSIIISIQVEHIRVEQDFMQGQAACLHTTIRARETTRRSRPTKEDTPTKAGTRRMEDTGKEGNDN